MTVNTIVTPSSQVESLLPGYINETYTEFVNFMTKSDESEERVGFSQDVLQNLQKYRDFNTYRNKIVQNGVLAKNISSTDTELILEDGFGFPEENGVLYIDDEIIYYRQKIDNTFYELERGASGTVILPTFTSKGTYRITTAAAHTVSSEVTNVSVLFLVSMLETIYETYAPEIIPERVSGEINNATLLENIKDFFQSKGSKVSIKALFKILFAENDVEVTYPGDRMITPSKSTWNESEILRVIPLSSSLVPSEANLATPDKFINAKLEYYLDGFGSDDTILATAICEYAVSYVFENVVQYEISLQKDSLLGNISPTPKTILTKDVTVDGTTITVESTIGFPYSGVIYIQNEGVSYTSKSMNQFFGCTRGHIGVAAIHGLADSVFGERKIRAATTLDGIKYETYCFVLGLADSIRVVDGGIMHKANDPVHVNGPGAINPRQPILSSFIENIEEATVTEAMGLPDVTNITASVSSVYFDPEFCLVSTSGLPYYTIGQFSSDDSVGPDLTANSMTYAIPTQNNLKGIDTIVKGTNQIGVFVDGVPAYSDDSPRRVVQGDIADFAVLAEGRGYVNPTVVIDPPYANADAVVVDGRISAIISTSTVLPDRYFTSNPTVRISSGEGSSFEIAFDLYGRITNVSVSTAGNFYKDTPVLSVVDSSNRGAGAVLTAVVQNGGISSVTIDEGGIDYNPATTSIVPLPIGNGALVEATVQYYQFNRYQEVVNNSNWTFDSGNGFLYQNPSEDVERSTYGYICSPTQLRNTLGDNGSQHSPILGWALDGNPIYGPYGYLNAKNDSAGHIRMTTGYTLQTDRSNIIPGGEINAGGISPPTVGAYDPSNGVYPMGTFTEDYLWEAKNIQGPGKDLETEDGVQLTTDSGLELVTNANFDNINYLDRNNGRICNTPDFPEEVYPDGIYAYFITVDAAEQPTFPYIIGRNYQNAPVEWYLDWSTQPYPEKIRFGSIPYTPSRNLNTSLVQRHRTPYLSGAQEDMSASVVSISSGGISSIVIESGLPETTMIGDLLYYDDKVENGFGASGIVTALKGESIVQSGGQRLVTQLISHRQKFDLSANDGTFTFVKDTEIRTWNDAVATIEKYEIERDASGNVIAQELTIQTTTLNLVEPNIRPNQPTFYDNVYKPVYLINNTPEDVILGTAPLGSEEPNKVVVSYYQPTVGIGGDEVKAGDLWWSLFDGRLFIYYVDNNSSQWVVTQPIGTTPYGTLSSPSSSLASDNALVAGESNPPVNVLNPGVGNTISISNLAPSQRSNGDPNKMGDLWWSPVTGCLFIWYTDGIVNYTRTGVYSETVTNSQWVITDPSGIAPLGFGSESYSTDVFYPDDSNASSLTSSIFTGDVTAMIGDVTPVKRPDGTDVEIGNLFWSRRTGKLYIYWNDGDSNQWTVCNPNASIVTEFSMDTFPGGEVGPGFFVSPLGQIEELSTQKLLWFDELDFFKPMDLVDFQVGAPGVEELTENSQVISLGPDDRNNGTFVRGYEDTALDLPNGTPMINQRRALYKVKCDAAVKVEAGDIVIFENSSFREVNAPHVVFKAGTVVPAEVTVLINVDGQVAQVNLISGGQFYSNDFIISFTGGGGQSAFARAIVSPLAEGGVVTSIELLNGGYNYSSPPTPVLGKEISNREFFIEVSEVYGDDNDNVSYVTTAERLQGEAGIVEVNSAGLEYTEIPQAMGLYKKQGDRASAIVNLAPVNSLEETSIKSVTVTSGGVRYVSPTAIFYDRTTSNGSGAKASVTVSNGVVTAINMISGGTGYIDPHVILVEESGKYISTTKNIGRIDAMKISDPGLRVSVDSTLRPELQIITRIIVKNPTIEFIAGDKVYQGTVSKPLVTATVVDYDSKIQQLTLEKVNGNLKEGENIYDYNGKQAMVVLQGEADTRVQIDGTAKPAGSFINDNSIIGSEYAHIQDSYYYQWFSYNIQSPLQKVQYETFVQDIVHPSGFIQFAELDINKSVDASVESEEVYISTVEIT